jgi:hypothetical protein
VQVGNLWLGTVPGEATTVAGRQMMARLREGTMRARRTGPPPVPSDSVAIIGLANGYLNYITTAAEYQAQTYEGGSTLYGPHSATFMAERLIALAAGMGTPTGRPVDSILVRPGPIRKTTLKQRAPIPFDARTTQARCAPGVVRVTWNDAAPGLFGPAEGSMVRFIRTATQDTIPDDHIRVEVRMVEKHGDRWRWEARWRPAPPLASGDSVAVEFPRWAGARAGCRVP